MQQCRTFHLALASVPFAGLCGDVVHRRYISSNMRRSATVSFIVFLISESLASLGECGIHRRM